MQTFVVRVWTPAPTEPRIEGFPLHGVVEHVGPQRRRIFHCETELLEFLRDCLAGKGRLDTGE